MPIEEATAEELGHVSGLEQCRHQVSFATVSAEGRQFSPLLKYVARGPGMRPHFSEEGRFGPTALDGMRAARMEHTPWWQGPQWRRQAWDAPKRPFLFERRQTGDEHLGIRMQGLREDVPDWRYLDQLPGIHHPEAVHELGHESHVVPDQDHGGLQVLLEPRQRLHHLLLHHHVQGAGGLVGDDHLGP